MARNQLNAPWLRPVLALLRVRRSAGPRRLRRRQRSAEQSVCASAADARTGVSCCRLRQRFMSQHTRHVDRQRWRSRLIQAFSSNPAILPVAQSVNGATVVLLANNVAAEYDSRHHGAGRDRSDRDLDDHRQPRADLQYADHHSSRHDVRHQHGVFGRHGDRSGAGHRPGWRGHSESRGQIRCRDGRLSCILTNNPAQPQVATLTVVSDANGNAQVILQASVNAPTQPAMLRATEITTGNTRDGVRSRSSR